MQVGCTHVYASKSPLLTASINCSVIFIISCLRATRTGRVKDERWWRERKWNDKKAKLLSITYTAYRADTCDNVILKPTDTRVKVPKKMVKSVKKNIYVNKNKKCWWCQFWSDDPKAWILVHSHHAVFTAITSLQIGLSTRRHSLCISMTLIMQRGMCKYSKSNKNIIKMSNSLLINFTVI